MRLFHGYNNKQMTEEYDRIVEAVRFSEKFIVKDITKYVIDEREEDFLSDGIISRTGTCQCIECGTYNSGIYFMEKGTSNALCLECLEQGQEIDFAIIDLVYVE